MTILVTGGAGYIGSHTCLELIKAGFDVIVVDNFCNSSPQALSQVEKIVGTRIPFIQSDIQDKPTLISIFNEFSIEAVIHFAGLKAVGESCAIPLHYYENNLVGTLVLCEVMTKYSEPKILFSSSATVYGNPVKVPITEDFATSATNPYGRSKLMVEEVLRDLCKAQPQHWSATLLRYFNPIGAHDSGLIGEDPQGTPNNLLPYVAQVASGKQPFVKVFGNDYPTPDGTGIRDYIHVVDLARGHVKALEQLLKSPPKCQTYNLGTGIGYSVLDIIETFKRISGQRIPYHITERRAGDIAECFADANQAYQALGWRAQYGLEKMIEDAWRWQKNNPNGYQTTQPFAEALC